MISRQGQDYSIKYELVQETELLQIVQSGEKLTNAFIYAMFDEFNGKGGIDSELFNAERLRSDTFDLFTPTIQPFTHENSVFHQNYLTRVVATTVKIAQKPTPI